MCLVDHKYFGTELSQMLKLRETIWFGRKNRSTEVEERELRKDPEIGWVERSLPSRVENVVKPVIHPFCLVPPQIS